MAVVKEKSDRGSEKLQRPMEDLKGKSPKPS